MTLTLKLTDQSELTLVDASYAENFVVTLNSKSEFSDVFNLMTDGNMAHMEIYRDGLLIQTITGATLMGAQAVINTDNTITGHFYYRGQYEQPTDEYAIAGRILLGEETL